MGLIESITRGAHAVRADASGTPAPWGDYWYHPVGEASAAGMRITQASAMRIGAVLACVGIVSRVTGMMPIKMLTQAPDGSTRIVRHHPLYDVLYIRPNVHQTAFEFKQMMQAHLELRGNAYAEIVEGPRGPVDQLLPMHPDRVKVERLRPSGKIRYAYNDPLTNTTRYLMEGEVFHLRNLSDDGITGQSTIGLAADLFGLALAQQDYSARYIKNDARPPFYFEGASFKTQADEDRWVASWQRNHTGEWRGKAGMLPPGMTIKELGVKPIDQQLLDSKKLSRTEIAALFPIPGHLIGEMEKTATYASVEQQNINFLVHCILPRVILWEQAIQRDLITSDHYFAKFSLAALLRGDTASRFAAYHQAIGDGWMSQDEVRGFEDMNPIPGGAGRRYWRPANWAPLDNVAAPVASTQQDVQSDVQDVNDGTSSPGTGDAAANAEVLRAHLQALATAAADRCVRKEIAALRKMAERGTSDYQLEEFYAEHLTFVSAVLNLNDESRTTVQQRYYGRVEELAAAFASNALANAIDRIAATEPLELAKIVTGGTK